jgi:hypothetical protein
VIQVNDQNENQSRPLKHFQRKSSTKIKFSREKTPTQAFEEYHSSEPAYKTLTPNKTTADAYFDIVAHAEIKTELKTNPANENDILRLTG